MCGKKHIGFSTSARGSGQNVFRGGFVMGLRFVSKPFSFLSLWIPHGKKQEAECLPPGVDFSDPPLTAQAKLDARILFGRMHREFSLSGIFTSPKARALGTAWPAIEQYGNLLDTLQNRRAPIVTMNTLAQPDSDEYDPENSQAKQDGPMKGWVIYGPESSPEDWWWWFQISLPFIEMMGKRTPLKISGPTTIWVYTHRPFVGCAALADSKTSIDLNKVDTTPLRELALSEDILPFVILEHTLQDNGSFFMRRLPLPEGF